MKKADKNECPKGCNGLTYMHDDHEKRSCCVCGFVYPNDTSGYIILNQLDNLTKH